VSVWRPTPAAAMLLVRRGLLALTMIGIAATAFELASERHWNGLEQYVPWLALTLLVVATVLVLLPGDRGTTTARVLALVVLGASAYGVIDHVLVNLQAGELDQRFADTWESLPLAEQVLYAVTKTVGPAPTLAPGVLAQVALLLLLATVCAPGRTQATPLSSANTFRQEGAQKA
jgi:hypothetical protein